MLESIKNSDLKEIVNNEKLSEELRISAKKVLESRNKKAVKSSTLHKISFEQACRSPELVLHMLNILGNRLGRPRLYGENNRSGGMLNVSYQTLKRWETKEGLQNLKGKNIARIVAAYNLVVQWKDNGATSQIIIRTFKEGWKDCLKGESKRREKWRKYFGIYSD